MVVPDAKCFNGPSGKIDTLLSEIILTKKGHLPYISEGAAVSGKNTFSGMVTLAGKATLSNIFCQQGFTVCSYGIKRFCPVAMDTLLQRDSVCKANKKSQMLRHFEKKRQKIY